MSVRVFLSINNNEEVLQLPVPPEKYRVVSAYGNETFETINQVFNIIGIKELKEMELSSFFPIRDYPFIQNRRMWGMAYVETIERWRAMRIPIRLVISSTRRTMRINMPVTIDNFEYETDKSGDIKYTMSLREFPFVQVGD